MGSLAALLEDGADVPLSPDGDDADAMAGVDDSLSTLHSGLMLNPGAPHSEQCLLDNREVSIPSELCLNADIFIDVMNNGWGSLTDQERIGLLKCLPTFAEPEKDFQEKLTTLDGLFAGANFHFGNPLKQFHASLNAGFYQPDVYRLREVSRKLKFHAHLERQQRHAVSLLCELATSRQQLLLDARCLPPAALDQYRLQKRVPLADKKHFAVKRARSRYAKIMGEVRQEAGWLDTSSSGEETEEYSGNLPNQFGDMALNGEGMDEDFMVKSCLKLRSKSLKKSPKQSGSFSSPPPPLGLDAELNDVLERADVKMSHLTLAAGKLPKQQAQQMNGSILTKSKKPGQRRNRLEVLKVACNDFVRKMLTTPTPIAPPPNIKNGLVNAESMNSGNNILNNPPAQPRSRPQSSVSLTPTPSTSTPPMMQPTESESGGTIQIPPSTSPPQLPPALLAATNAGKVESFFHVVHGLLSATPDNRATLTSLEQLVKQWVQVASSNMTNPNASWQLRWMADRSNWHSELPSAMRFLSGTFCPANYPMDFVPLVDMNDRSGHWVWLEEDGELNPPASQYLCLLYRCWLDAQLSEKQIPSPTLTFRPETEQDLYFFHDQERKRFQMPTEPFIYVLTMPTHRELVVGPVRVTPSRIDSFSSNRKGVKDHSILTTERPPAVTVLTLVRDAVARLAGGEGTRTDICNLLRDSQFIRRELNSHQLTNAVSGALDRLHSERDPCARYDSTKKLWVYLHRGRTREDFLRIGQMLMLAAKRRQAKDNALTASSLPMGSASSSSTTNGMQSLGGSAMPNASTGINSSNKNSTSTAKSNPNSRRTSAASLASQPDGGTGANMLQRKSSSISSGFPSEQPPMAPQQQQQPGMMPPQMQQQPPPQQQQLPSPSHVQPPMFNGPMIRPPMPSQVQNLQMQQSQQSSPCQPMQQPPPQQGQQPPQHMMPSQPNMPPQAMGWPPNNAVTMSMPVSMMGGPSQGPTVVMANQMGAAPTGNPGMVPMHMAGGQQMAPIRHQGMHPGMIPPGMSPQQQQAPQPPQHFQPPPQQQQQQQQQYHPQMHHPQHMAQQPPPQHLHHGGPQGPQHMPGPPQHSVDPQHQYYAEQQQQMHNQQMLLFHHQQQQQQQQYRIAQQQQFQPHHHMPQQTQPPQNMMQQTHVQFQAHPHGL